MKVYIPSPVPGGTVIRFLLSGLLVGLLIIASCGESDSPTEPVPSPGPQFTPFEVSFGGSGIDIAEAAVQARDGGYIVVGRTNSFNAAGYDIYIAKLSASGERLWEKVYGTTMDDAACAVLKAANSGYVIAGTRGTYAFQCKIDEAGDIVWLKEYGGGGLQEGRAVVSTSDGGYGLVGWTNSFGAGGQDVYLVRTDSVGVMLWQKTYGGTVDEQGHAVVATEDHGFAITGQVGSSGGGQHDVYFVRVDSVGAARSYRSYGGPQSDEGEAIISVSGGGFLIVGSTLAASAGGSDILLIKTDSGGNSIHQKIFGGQFDDFGRSLIPTADGGCLIAGSSESFGNGEEDIYIVKADATDRLVWQRTFGSAVADQGLALVSTSDGGILVAGSTDSNAATSTDMYVVKTTAQP